MEDRNVYEASKERKSSVGVKWVKANDSDSTYLCKSSDLKNLREMSDAELRSICLDESHNPQND
jgi:hypothetical protein